MPLLTATEALSPVVPLALDLDLWLRAMLSCLSNRSFPRAVSSSCFSSSRSLAVSEAVAVAVAVASSSSFLSASSDRYAIKKSANSPPALRNKSSRS